MNHIAIEQFELMSGPAINTLLWEWMGKPKLETLFQPTETLFQPTIDREAWLLVLAHMEKIGLTWSLINHGPEDGGLCMFAGAPWAKHYPPTGSKNPGMSVEWATCIAAILSLQARDAIDT